jgi:hypothetical protein
MPVLCEGTSRMTRRRAIVTSENGENCFDSRLMSDMAKAMTIAIAVARRSTPHESARSAHTFQHTPPSLAIPDLHPVAFQFEGPRLVGVGEIRR